MIVIVMGVSGAGKTAIGSELARRLGCTFLDADDYHPPANVAKMAQEIPLTDDDRWPWLDRVNVLLRGHDSAVVACSALKRVYRERLAAGLACCEFVYLHGTVDLLRARLQARQHRYMPASLLESQFAALEPPERAIAVDVAQPPERCVEVIIAALRNKGSSS